MSSGLQRLKVSGRLVLPLLFLSTLRNCTHHWGLLMTVVMPCIQKKMWTPQRPECMDRLRVAGGWCVFCSPCLGWSLMLLWCPVSDYLLNYRRESCRATDSAAAFTAWSPHLTSCFRSVRNGVLESGGGRAGVDEHCDRNSSAPLPGDTLTSPLLHHSL